MILLLSLFTGMFSACSKKEETSDIQAEQQDRLATYLPPTRIPGSPIYTPTPDAPHPIPVLYDDGETYTVQPGDTLADIAMEYEISIYTLTQHNDITDRDYLEVGQKIKIPIPSDLPPGPDLKIIPDSELVNSPSAIQFSIESFLSNYSGYIHNYQEVLDGEPYSGAEIIRRVSLENSVHPRILIAVLEYQSHWLTSTQPFQDSLEYPLLYADTNRTGLYKQLSWAADQLNRGFYLWQINGLNKWTLKDGTVIAANAFINAGTAGVQLLMSQLYGNEKWQEAVGSHGIFDTFINLFGYPFLYSIDPLLPDNLLQPSLHLPFSEAETWYFTGGPHGGWGNGSAWAALDFAPPGNGDGCEQSDSWVTAVASGRIVYTGNGIVIQDLESDGYEEIGWTIFYMHIESRDRVIAGMELQSGDHIGHPSCEGGVSTGTHVHVARKYNGAWISADGSIPLEMDGWITKGEGELYNGALIKGNQIVEAWDTRKDENQIQR
jgi:murein DD-endopeptidase MepM/ murein hydrolase activator NlpD